jgi:hypothetical protein
MSHVRCVCQFTAAGLDRTGYLAGRRYGSRQAYFPRHAFADKTFSVGITGKTIKVRPTTTNLPGGGSDSGTILGKEVSTSYGTMSVPCMPFFLAEIRRGGQRYQPTEFQLLAA